MTICVCLNLTTPIYHLRCITGSTGGSCHQLLPPGQPRLTFDFPGLKKNEKVLFSGGTNTKLPKIILTQCE